MTSFPPRRAGTDPKANALVEAFLDEKRRESPAEGNATTAARRRPLVLGAVALICAAAWLVPYPSSADDGTSRAALEAASARITVFLAASKVQEYRTRFARLPETLAAAGVTDSTIEYSTGRDDSFTLRAVVSGERITYDSHHPPHTVLGDAVAIVERRGN